MLEQVTKEKNRFLSFVQDNTDSIFIIDTNKKIQYINDAFITLFEFNEEELISKELPVIPDWLKKETEELLDQVLDGKKMQAMQVKGQKKSGELVDLSVTLSPIFDEAGLIIGMSGIGRDITEMKKNEMEWKKEKDELTYVWDYSDNAICTIGYDGSILRANPAFENLFGLNSEEVENLTLSSIQPEFFNNQIDTFITRLREDMNPITSNTKQQRTDGTMLDVEVMYRPIQKGNVLALAIYKDITESKQLVATLKVKEEKYRRILASIPEAMMIHQNGKVININQLGLELLKAKSLNQVIGRNVLDFVHSRDRNIVTQRMQQAEQQLQNAEQKEEKFLDINGDSFYAEASNVPITIDGESSVLVVVRDITAKRRAEKAMKASEERFRIIAENSADLIKILTPNGKVAYTSPAIEDVLGYPVRDIIGRPFIESVHPDDVVNVNQRFSEMLETKEKIEIEARRIHQEGYFIWLHSHVTPIVDVDGEMDKIIVISRDVTENKRKEEKLAKMAYYDHLTGLPNRRLFNDRLEQAMYTTDRTGKLTALMVLDCDKFKNINDTLGHDVGDGVIKEFADRVRSSLRKTDTLSRVGGDEFTIVLPELKSELDAIEVANRILEKVREPMFINGHDLEITTSIGTAFYPIDGNQTDTLFKNADENLYKAKERGGNTLYLNIY